MIALEHYGLAADGLGWWLALGGAAIWASLRSPHAPTGATGKTPRKPAPRQPSAPKAKLWADRATAVDYLVLGGLTRKAAEAEYAKRQAGIEARMNGMGVNTVVTKGELDDALDF